MRRYCVLLAGLLLACLGAAVAEEAKGPPPVLAISREEIKPGRMVPHDKVATGFVTAVARGNPNSYRLGLTPVSGDDNVVLYLEGHGSFAALEASRKEFEQSLATNASFKAELDQVERQGSDLHASQKTALYWYRADLSYRPRNVNETALSRYMNILTVRVKPGRVPDYIENVKAFNAARDKANIDAHSAVYQSASGAPSGTFLIFTSNRSLSEWDENFAQFAERQKAIEQAYGGVEAAKQRRMELADIVAWSESALYAMNPTISRPIPEFAAADPDFWGPRRPPMAKAVIKKETPAPKKEEPKP